jgi:hypothetical protein
MSVAQTRASEEGLATVLGALCASGIQGALQALNERVPHRFTALYRFDGNVQRAVFVHDRLGQPCAWLNALPLASVAS